MHKGQDQVNFVEVYMYMGIQCFLNFGDICHIFLGIHVWDNFQNN